MAFLFGVLVGIVVGFLIGGLVWDVWRPHKKKPENHPLEVQGRYTWVHNYYCPRCKVPLFETDGHTQKKYEYINHCRKCHLVFDWSGLGIAWQYDEDIYSNNGEENQNVDV